ncbi:hypothetical protein LGN11_26545 [Burkholderia multivorans]|nr:hypothetical protein [Burkholderia multivorans]
MDSYAVVENGLVVNIVEWDGVATWAPPDGTSAVKIPNGETVGIGFGFDGSQFKSPQ